MGSLYQSTSQYATLRDMSQSNAEKTLNVKAAKSIISETKVLTSRLLLYVMLSTYPY